MPDFIENNHKAVNQAVEQEMLRQKSLLLYYNDGSKVLKSQVIKNFLVGGSAFIIAVAIVIWLFFVKSNEPQIIENSEGGSNKEVLDQLILNSKPSIENETFTHSTFTVFHSTSLGNGKEVVTGHVYQKSDLDHPSSQYCYYSENNEALSETNITLEKWNKFGVKDFQVTNRELKQYLRSCNFHKY